MKADFLDAHESHWDDAERLFTASRFANADHLYGIAAECGLKRLMLAFGMPFDAIKDRPANRDDRNHIAQIWERFESYRSGHANGPGYLLAAPNPFNAWDVSDRYAHQANFDQTYAQPHQAGATVVCTLIKKAQFEGLLV